MKLRRLLIYLWTAPTTALGLVFVPVALISGGGIQWVDGVLEVYGGAVRFVLARCTLMPGEASAMTLGHVVLGQDAASLEWSRSHERVHVRQCERWGPLFVPAYLLGSAVALLCGGKAYRDNPFEREAYEAGGGDQDRARL
jgi:hypothetical protein